MPRLVLALLFSSLGAVPSVTRAEPPPRKRSEDISWSAFGAGVFERARQEHKLILLDVGIEGCTACRWMHEDTYRDPAVISRIRGRFIAVRADAEAQPDLGERYADWGWPATIFLTGEGRQLLAVRGNRRPRNFLPILEQVLTADPGRPPPPPPSAVAAAGGGLRERLSAQLDRYFEPQFGGWGKAPKLPLHEPIAHALLRAHLTGQPGWQERALQTLEGHARLIDPVWGGVFVGSPRADWGDLIPEKRIADQAGALWDFATAYQLTGAANWRDRALAIDRYLRTFLRAKDGTYFTSQQDEPPRLPAHLSSREYYELPDPERRRIGPPPTDHATYTDLNGQIISGYVRLYEATLDPAHLDAARGAADTLLATRMHPDGWVRQFVPGPELRRDQRMRPAAESKGPYLRSQAQFGLALMALYGVTAQQRYLDAVRRLVSALRRQLEDPVTGGFYASVPDGTETLLSRRKPTEQNAAAARLLFSLGTLDHSEDLKRVAERALQTTTSPAALASEGRMIGEAALAAELIGKGLMEMSVVGSQEDPRAQALYLAALRTYEPRRLLRYEAPGRYPARDGAALYVCDGRACSSPIVRPDAVAAVVRRFAAQR